MDAKEFERLLAVCRIPLKEDEKAKMQKEIDEVLAYFSKIDSIDCKSEPAYQPVDIPERLRDDIVKNCAETDLILKNTKTYRFYIVGPKV